MENAYSIATRKQHTKLVILLMLSHKENTVNTLSIDTVITHSTLSLSIMLIPLICIQYNA